MLVDHFLELFRQSAHSRKQAAFCLNEILGGINQGPSAVGPRGCSEPAACKAAAGENSIETPCVDSESRRAMGRRCEPDELDALVRCENQLYLSNCCTGALLIELDSYSLILYSANLCLKQSLLASEDVK